MGLPRQVKKQLKEAEEILAQLNTKPGDAPPGGPPNPDAPPPPAPPPPLTLVPDNKNPAQPDVPPGDSNPPPPPPPGEDFEAKYRTLKGKYDSEVAAARHENARMSERVAVLEQLLANLTDKSNPPPPPAPATTADDKRVGKKYVRPEDIEEYGNDMAEFVARAAREAVEPELETLRAENARLKTQVGQTSQQVAVSGRGLLFARLDKDVPGWQDTNKDQKFLAWLQELDVFSGFQRSSVLEKAYNSNDADRVVGIFKAFLREDSATNQPPPPAPRTAAVALETLVAPGTPRGPAAVAPGDNKGRIITQAEISTFYDNKRRGKVTPADAAVFEREIALAVKENRITL